MSTLQVNLELIRKYNTPGPRYTSYPPAPQFTDKVSFEQLQPRIEANNKPIRDLSLYFHLPFCRVVVLVLRLHDGDHDAA